MTNQNRDYFLSNKAYDILKFIAVVLLPALGTLYFTLANTWGLPAAEQVLGTGAAFATFLGVVLKLGDRSYNNSKQQYDGEINVLTNSKGGLKYDMVLKGDPEGIQDLNAVKFKVNP